MKENKKVASSSQIKAVLRLLTYIFKNNRFLSTIVITFLVVSTTCMVYGTLLIKKLIDTYIIPNIGKKSWDLIPLTRLIYFMATIYLIEIVCTYIYRKAMTFIAQGTMKKLRDDVFTHMQSLAIKYFDSNENGDIMSIYSSDIDTLKTMINESLIQMLSAIFTMFSVISSMFVLSIPLTVFALIMIATIIVATKLISKKSSVNFKEQQKNIGKLNGYIEEMIEGLKVVKIFSYEKEVEKKFDELNENLFKSANNAHRYSNILMPVVGNLSNINFVLTASIGTFLALYSVGGFTIGALASFLQFTRTLRQPVFQIAQQINILIMAAAGSSRIFKLLDQKKEDDRGYVKLVNIKTDETGSIKETKEHTGKWAWRYTNDDGKINYVKLEGDIVFENVNFGYNNEKIILHNINLYAKPGQKIAFVGATGAGKTTITNLISRFYDVQSGKIKYDGIDIKNISKADLRRSLAMVLQDSKLFSGTIADNIRYGRLDASDDEIRAAAKLANAHQFIKYLPDAYNTYLSHGASNLSQGQRQLLAIARAAVADPPVLILDEATSSIDTRTEKIVQDGMDKIMKGRTVFVIAHRLSTIKNADVIMVLDNGRIVERGNHEELMIKKGIYHQLYIGGFKEE